MTYKYLIMKNILFAGVAALALTAACCGPEDGIHTVKLLTTNDVHGTYFDSTYVDTQTRPSLLAVKWYADSVRAASGADNVILLDAGDFLQGDNASYYFNYVDTETPHIYPRLASAMGYDVIVGGNHDIETGHAVYDRVAADLKAAGIPFLAGNAIRRDNGKPYFPYYTILHKAGLKVAVLGFDNANIKAWLSESLWSGMTFESLIPLVQQDVDKVIRKEKPQLVIVAVHSGTGEGDGSMLESQGLDLFNSLQGVDFLVCAHDHSPVVFQNEGICLINAGSHSRNVGYGEAAIQIRKGRVVAKDLSASLIRVDKSKADATLRGQFRSDYEAVRGFTLREVGTLAEDIRTRDAFKGMCDYMNLIHTVCLRSEPAQISFAAPLTYNGTIKAGTLVYNDMFTIYPYENQLFVVKMTGRQVKDYLENSYNLWIKTVSGPGDHVFNIAPRDDSRNSQRGWSFVERTYNFDSAAGICYTVDVTKPFGDRVNVSTLADGTPFDFEATYNVAMTSYRASGGGGLATLAGLDTDNIDSYVVEKYPEIRNLVYDYILAEGGIHPEKTGERSFIGEWKFIPETLASEAVEADFDLVF